MSIFARIHPRIDRRYAAGLAMTALAVVHSAPAFAQSTPAAPQDAQTAPQDSQATPDDGKEIIVTGSRVARSGFSAPTPLTVLSAAEIQNQSPSNNLADFINQQPALAGSTRPANSRLNLSSGQAGINALNLRNLGEIRTLVLIDGRRSVGSTITGLVDVNTIPQSLVKSVEIVTGGASAAYGSDAVAGVVNFILDKKFTGIKLTADNGVTTYGDGFNYSAGITAGTSFAGGRGHILFNAEIAHRDGIFTVDRDWNATGYVRIQDPNWVPQTVKPDGTIVPGSSTPRYLIRRQVGAANSTPGGLITASSGGTSLRGVYFGQGGTPANYQFGALSFPTSGTPSLTQGGDWKVNDSGRRIGLDPQDDRHGVYGRLSYEVTPGIELFAEGSYNWQHILFNAGPNLSTGISIAATNCNVVPTPTTCNAYLLQQLGAARLTGVTSVTVATTAADLPFRAADNRRKVQRYVIGGEGSFDAFGKPAHWDVYAQYGRADLREQLRGIMNTARMNNATAAVFTPAGNPKYAAGSIQCLINVDASTTNDDPNCVPLNRLGVGVADPAAIAYVLGNPYRDEIAEQKVAGVNLALTPFATWAGDVSLAVGGEWREEKISGSVPTQFQPVVTPNPGGGISTANAWSVGNFLPTNGKYNVKEAYLETVVPLGLGLEFNGAVRATDYSTSGYVTTWKLGATWQPIPDIRLRITRSRDIRAPNLNELYAAGSSNSDSVSNPFGAGSGPNGGNYGTSISYSALALGNPNLRPEKSNQWNVGAVLSPRFLPGFNFSADYFRIDMKDAIDTLSAQEIINRCKDGRPEYCASITQDPNNATRILIRTQPFNFARKLVRGIDFEGSYRVALDGLFKNASSFTLRGTATRYIENISDPGIPGNIVISSVGANGGQTSTPTWIFRFSATLDMPTTSVTAVARGVSAGVYTTSGIECTTACPTNTTTTSTYQTYDDNQVSGLFYFDLNLAQKIKINNKSDAEFFVNVTNVFNRWPLLVPETGLAANSTYSDMLGRTFRVGVRIKLR